MACAKCGANDYDFHMSDCEYVRNLIENLHTGKAKVMFHHDDIHGIPITVYPGPDACQDRRTAWQKTHGLNDKGEFPHHQPECRDFI